MKSHSKLYLWGVLGFPPPTFRGRVEGTNLYWAPGMECRREPWCVTKIVKTTLEVLKPSKMSVVTLKTIEVNFARLGWRDAPGGAPKAHSILGPRGGNSEKISEVTFSSFFVFSLHRQMSNFGYRHQASGLPEGPLLWSGAPGDRGVTASASSSSSSYSLYTLPRLHTIQSRPQSQLFLALDLPS